MAIVSTFCKKGGVGKSTFIGFMAHYYASLGKKVLIISTDDQNSIFKIFGIEDDGSDNYLEFLLAGRAELGDILIDARENLYMIKSLNTDNMSLKLTLERSQEKVIRKMLQDYSSFFDYIFVDAFPGDMLGGDRPALWCPVLGLPRGSLRHLPQAKRRAPSPSQLLKRAAATLPASRRS